MRYEELLKELRRFFYAEWKGDNHLESRVDVIALVEYCLELSKGTDDIRDFAKVLGMEVIPNSRFAKKISTFRIKEKARLLQGKSSRGEPNLS